MAKEEGKDFSAEGFIASDLSLQDMIPMDFHLSSIKDSFLGNSPEDVKNVVESLCTYFGTLFTSNEEDCSPNSLNNTISPIDQLIAFHNKRTTVGDLRLNTTIDQSQSVVDSSFKINFDVFTPDSKVLSTHFLVESLLQLAFWSNKTAKYYHDCLQRPEVAKNIKRCDIATRGEEWA